MKLNTKLIEKFYKKQNFSQNDKTMQLRCIKEEVAELETAGKYETKERELQEVADVLVTMLVYSKITGLRWIHIEREFERKMKINNLKPVREKSGVKVKKK